MSVRLAARIGAGLCALVICGAGWAAFAPAAAAVSGIQTGYWSALPAAPQVPAGGLEVAANASGPQAVAAVKFTLADGESAPVLTLKVAQAQPQSQVVIEACQIPAAAGGWTPPAGGGPGALSSAPKPDCAGGLVSGALSADGATMTFDLTLMPSDGGIVDVLLQPSKVPSPAAGTAPGAPNDMYPDFDASFQPVEAAAIAVSGGGTSTSGSSTLGSGASGGTTGGGGTVAAPGPVGQPVALPPPAAGVAGTGVAPVVASPQPTTSNAAAAAPALLMKKRNLRLLFAVALASSDILFLLVWLDRRLPGNDKPLISIYDPPPLAS